MLNSPEIPYSQLAEMFAYMVKIQRSLLLNGVDDCLNDVFAIELTPAMEDAIMNWYIAWRLLPMHSKVNEQEFRLFTDELVKHFELDNSKRLTPVLDAVTLRYKVVNTVSHSLLKLLNLAKLPGAIIGGAMIEVLYQDLSNNEEVHSFDYIVANVRISF